MKELVTKYRVDVNALDDRYNRAINLVCNSLFTEELLVHSSKPKRQLKWYKIFLIIKIIKSFANSLANVRVFTFKFYIFLNSPFRPQFYKNNLEVILIGKTMKASFLGSLVTAQKDGNVTMLQKQYNFIYNGHGFVGIHINSCKFD